MARVLEQPQQPMPSTSSDTYTLDIINLNNLLTRLEQNIFITLSAEYTHLQQPQLHCTRIGANVDYAQTLLNKIERSLPSVKAPAIRHERTTDLTKKRARYDRIRQGFDWIKDEVEKMGEREEDNDHGIDGTNEENDDIWDGIIPVSASEKEDNAVAVAEIIEGESEIRNNVTAPEEDTSMLRQRRHDKTLSSISSSSTAAMASGAFTSTQSKPTATTTATTSSTNLLPTSPPSLTDAKEKTLSTHRAEQENLTTSLINLASQLKVSSEAFQTSLENEKGVLNRVVEGLDRNLTGMEAAGKRMGVLRRMTEGRGWWGRMLMYAWIFLLWLAALAIVYLGPKLRF